MEGVLRTHWQAPGMPPAKCHSDIFVLSMSEGLLFIRSYCRGLQFPVRVIIIIMVTGTVFNRRNFNFFSQTCGNFGSPDAHLPVVIKTPP